MVRDRRLLVNLTALTAGDKSRDDTMPVTLPVTLKGSRRPRNEKSPAHIACAGLNW
jgi:hypothetical protein